MARKGRVQVKKKVARRRKDRPESAPVSEVENGERIEPRQVQLQSVESGVPEDLIEELTRTQKSISFARAIQFFVALLFLALGITWLVMQLRSGAELAGNEAATLSADTFVLVVQLAGCGIASIILASIGLRMHRFLKAIDALESSRDENDLEFVVGYLRGVWILIGGSFIALMIGAGAFALFLQ